MIRVVVAKVNHPNPTKDEKEANLTAALRTFKRKVNRDGILQECRKREYYVKPGVAKRLKHEAALKEKRLAMRKMEKWKKDY